MSAVERILVIADPEMSVSPALRRAGDLARIGGARLLLCVFAYDALIDAGSGLLAASGELDAPALVEAAKQDFLTQRRHWAAERVAAWQRQGIEADYEVIWTPVPHEALVAKTMEDGSDLVIKDMTRHSGLLRWLHSSADWKMLRFCPVPLMLVGNHATTRPRRIAAAVDAFQELHAPSELNQSVWNTARQIGHYCGAEVQLVSSFPWTSVASANPQLLGQLRQQAEREHREAFTALSRRLNAGEGQSHRLVGAPETALKHYVKQAGIDLLVVGSAYRSGVARLLLGSTAEDLLADIECDVLIVRPADFLLDLEQHLDIRGLLRRKVASEATWNALVPRPRRLPRAAAMR